MGRALLGLALLLLTAAANVFAADSRPQWANPDRWEFLGTLTFDVPKLRDALAADINVLLASREPIDSERLAEVLGERLAAGYRHSGFPEVTVRQEVISERQRIALHVVEGPSFRNGEIRVDGAKTVPVAELITGLTEGTGPQDAFLRWAQPPEQGGVREWYKPNGEKVEKEAAVWKRNKPTAFASGREAAIVAKAKLILQRCGYLDSLVSTTLEPQADGLTTLVVTIDDEGPRSILGDIAIHGNKINTDEQILSYLGVQPGQALDIESGPRWQWQLQESARFYESKVEVTPPPFGTGPARLDVHVVEIPGVPSLAESLTPLQQAAVRAAAWMTAVKKEDWQLSATAKIPAEFQHYLVPAWRGADALSVRLTLSTADGAAILEVDFHDRDGNSLWTAHAHFNRDQLQLVNLTRQAKLSFNIAETKLILTANWTVRKPDQEGRASAMFFGFGFNNNGKNGPRVPEIRTTVSPAAVLVEALKPEYQAGLEDGVLKLVRPGSTMEFDADSGRLREFSLNDDGKLLFSLKAETGFYRRRLGEVSTAYAACAETMQDHARLSQACRFILDEVEALELASVADHPEAVAIAHRLLDAGVLRGIDQELRPEKFVDEDDAALRWSFEIPPEIPTGPPHPLAWLKPMLHVGFRGYSLIFPRETGAWVAGREAALSLLAGKKGAVPPARVVEVLDHADAGPISYLLAAELFQFVSPYHRYVLSSAAVERLDSPAVRSDLQVLANDRSLAGTVVLALVTALRDAPPEDLAVIASWVTKSQFDDVLQPAFRELARRKDEPLAQVLPEVLEQVYPALIRPLLVAELQRMEAPVRAAAAKPDIKPLALPETPFDGTPKKKASEPPPDITKQQFLPKRD